MWAESTAGDPEEPGASPAPRSGRITGASAVDLDPADQKRWLTPAKNVRLGPYCGAKTPMPEPSRIS